MTVTRKKPGKYTPTRTDRYAGAKWKQNNIL